jgi:dnd system-associated protein 4
MRDVLLFAAGVGVSTQRQVPFDKSGETIRYETMTAEVFAEAFISMIAAVTTEEDPEILDGSRLGERILIFEEFANGGLEYIQEQANVRRQPHEVILRTLVTEALTDARTAEPASINELLQAL